ncbi:phage recombination protein Bet [Streptomyces sp. NPDC001530]|uniref:phage recombination protein Bet n=1 Tax=Streptomyces sp. NPDC001530 TaxID=3364582 RepID=UPI00367E0D55
MSNELVKSGGALAIRPDQTAWTEQQGAVLRQSGISDQVTAAELSGFLHLCQRTQLDPFSRQIYLIGRYDRRAGREVFTPQTGIDGYRVVAHRVIAASGETFGYEDTLWCDASGRWCDAWLAEEPPAAAKVTVLRNGQRFSAVALFREYVQTGKEGKRLGLWGKMPAGQVAKCAEALALRKAFPHDLAGVYTAEEMAQADNAGDERHLRAVQPGEADPWATATPQPQQQTVAANGRSQPAQDLADAAADAADQAAVKDVYKQAHAAGLLTETVKTADRELLELGAYLIRRGQELAKPAPSGDVVVDAEVVETVTEGPSEADVAEHQLRTAAAKAGLSNLDEEFERSYGLPIREAGAQQMREMTRILTGSAA